jgi:hypothetical protein
MHKENIQNDETLPIINKSKHPKEGEQNGRTHVQEDKRTTYEGEPQKVPIAPCHRKSCYTRYLQ